MIQVVLLLAREVELKSSQDALVPLSTFSLLSTGQAPAQGEAQPQGAAVAELGGW